MKIINNKSNKMKWNEMKKKQMYNKDNKMN